jgi:hypothetical protein
MVSEVAITLSDDEGTIEVVDAGEGNVLIAGYSPNAPTGTEALVEVVLNRTALARLVQFLDGILMENTQA